MEVKEKENDAGVCITVWVDLELKEGFDREILKLGLNRSMVMRQLIKRWLVQRRLGKKKEPLELAGLGVEEG